MRKPWCTILNILLVWVIVTIYVFCFNWSAHLLELYIDFDKMGHMLDEIDWDIYLKDLNALETWDKISGVLNHSITYCVPKIKYPPRVSSRNFTKRG